MPQACSEKATPIPWFLNQWRVSSSLKDIMKFPDFPVLDEGGDQVAIKGSFGTQGPPMFLWWLGIEPITEQVYSGCA